MSPARIIVCAYIALINVLKGMERASPLHTPYFLKYALEKSKSFIFIYFWVQLFSFTPTFYAIFISKFPIFIPALYLSFPLLPYITASLFILFPPK